MRRLLVAVAVAAILIPALVLPVAAATKTIPATAFKPLFNYSPDAVTTITTPTALFVFASTTPDEPVMFWAQVPLPVGATIVRVNYWYADSAARGTKLSLRSTRWGTLAGTLMAEIATAGAANELTQISTTDIATPKVTAGQILVLMLALPPNGVCGGVKIDYRP
jgi:hypothetical protein